MNETVVKLTQTPLTVDNRTFLKAIFGPHAAPRAHVCGFPEDPGDLLAIGKNWAWAGGAAKDLFDFDPNWNTFFTISVFHPDAVSGRSRRMKSLYDRTYCIVLDDVGLRGLSGTSAKVEPDKVKLKPSWALETSPGNWQLGYIIEAGDGRGGKVAGLLEALVNAGLVSDGSDPGMKGVTRYVRLPVGRNMKAKYGQNGFQHVMGSWNPDRTYTLEQIADAYGVRAEFDQAPDDLGANVAGTFDFGTDQVGNALKAAGKVLSEDPVKKLWHVECPFIDEHTQRDDSGSAYLGEGRWRCYHGHCEDRPHEDFTQKFRADNPDAWTESLSGLELPGEQALAPSAKGEIGQGPGGVDAQREALSNPLEDAQEVQQIFGRWSAIAATPPPAPEYTVPGYIPKGLLTSLYGVDGIGKNMTVQRACMQAITRGTFWGQTVKPDLKISFLGTEDVDAAILDRAHRIGRELQLTGADWAELDARLFMPELLDADAKLMHWDGLGNASRSPFYKSVISHVGKYRPDLLILDPISDLFEDEESNRARVAGFLRDLNKFARRAGVGVLLLGHPARSEGSEYSGSGAWSSKVRSRLLMEEDEDVAGSVFLRHRKGSYGPLLGDRILSWQSGVLVDQAAQGFVMSGAALLRHIMDTIHDLSVQGIVCSNAHNSPNRIDKIFKHHNTMPQGLGPKDLMDAVRQAIHDGHIIANQDFNGQNGVPLVRGSNRQPKVGIWFSPPVMGNTP